MTRQSFPGGTADNRKKGLGNVKDLMRKLTSRKLWVAIAGFVSGLIVAFDGNAEMAETVSGLILQGASVLGYLIAEGLADAAHSETVIE